MNAHRKQVEDTMNIVREVTYLIDTPFAFLIMYLIPKQTNLLHSKQKWLNITPCLANVSGDGSAC